MKAQDVMDQLDQLFEDLSDIDDRMLNETGESLGLMVGGNMGGFMVELMSCFWRSDDDQREGDETIKDFVLNEMETLGKRLLLAVKLAREKPVKRIADALETLSEKDKEVKP